MSPALLLGSLGHSLGHYSHILQLDVDPVCDRDVRLTRSLITFIPTADVHRQRITLHCTSSMQRRSQFETVYLHWITVNAVVIPIVAGSPSIASTLGMTWPHPKLVCMEVAQCHPVLCATRSRQKQLWCLIF